MIATARIEVQQSFCKNCSAYIKQELQIIEDIKNVRLYPKDSLITFNFLKADKLSSVLNTLSKLGYSEKGERVELEVSKSLCNC